jgi:hypothetical protein
MPLAAQISSISSDQKCTDLPMRGLFLYRKKGGGLLSGMSTIRTRTAISISPLNCFTGND